MEADTVKFPRVTHSTAASILACQLRGESHESLACHAANLTVECAMLRAGLNRVAYPTYGVLPYDRRERALIDDARATLETVQA